MEKISFYVFMYCFSLISQWTLLLFSFSYFTIVLLIVFILTHRSVPYLKKLNLWSVIYIYSKHISFSFLLIYWLKFQYLYQAKTFKTVPILIISIQIYQYFYLWLLGFSPASEDLSSTFSRMNREPMGKIIPKGDWISIF